MHPMQKKTSSSANDALLSTYYTSVSIRTSTGTIAPMGHWGRSRDDKRHLKYYALITEVWGYPSHKNSLHNKRQKKVYAE